MELADIYTELILEHSRNTKNKRELDEPTHKELGHNPSCGDEITLMLKIKDDKITDISFTGHGCAISQASTSIMIDLVKNMKIEAAKNLCQKFISMIKGEITDVAQLEELEDAQAFENIKNMPARVKCAVLPWHTLYDILENDRHQGSFIPN